MSATEKTTLKLVVYIDIKSGDLRDALRIILKDIQWVSLSGDKPAVCIIAHVPSETFKLIHTLGRANPAVPLPSRARSVPRQCGSQLGVQS